MLRVNRLRSQNLHSSLVVRVASAIAILVGGLVLLGWYFHIEVIKAGFPSSPVTMKANTALCFVLSGVSLWLSQKGKSNQSTLDGEINTRLYKTNLRSSIIYLRIAKIIAALVALISSLTLIQYLFGWNLGINELLFLDSPTPANTFRPGLMGLNTALNFLLISRALDLLIYPNKHRSYWYAQILSLVVALISLQAVIGYAYKVQVFYGTTPYTTSMALHTALTFIVLCVGMLWLCPDRGCMGVIMSNTYSGLLARPLLVAAIAVPFILGWLILQGQQVGHYSPAFALSLFALILIVIFVFLVWQGAATIERLYRQNEIERKQAKEQIVQLNKSLQRRITELQTLLEVIPIGIGIAEDTECQNIKVNPAFAKQLGISSDINASLSAPVDERPSFKVYQDGKELSPEQLPMQYAASHGVEVLNFEADVIHENGKVVKLLEYVAPLFDEEGKTRGSVGVFLDITERKQAEAILRNQHKWLEDVLNLMPMPLLFIEPETARVTFANRAADELAGGEFPKGVPAEEYHKVYHYTDAAGERIPNEQMPGVRVARGERLDGLEVNWHTSGGVRSLHIFAESLPAMHGYPATCLLAFQDITNLKQADKALSLGYKRLQLLFSTANDLLSSQQPIALLDSVFRKLAEQIGLDVYFNYLIAGDRLMRLASFTGISEELAKQIEWLEYGQAVCGTVAQRLRAISVENVQHSSDAKTDLIRSLGITAYYCYPLMAQGRLLGTLSFGSRSRTSFTENQKGMMQAVCDQIAIAMERASLIASLQQQTEQLSEANRMKDEFLAILSHELRSPLNAILGWAQLLRARKLSEIQIAKALETIERNAKAQTQLIEDLLDISRMIRGNLRLNVKTCNLVPIIESAIETVKLAAQAKEIDLRFFLSPIAQTQNANSENPECGCFTDKNLPASFLVSGDAERLQQIIWNLLSNAIKFTPRGGKVEIKLSVANGGKQTISYNGGNSTPVSTLQENVPATTKESSSQHWLSNTAPLQDPCGLDISSTWGNSSVALPHSKDGNQTASATQRLTTGNYAQIQVSDTGIGISQEFLPYVFDRFRQADSSSTRSHGGLGLGLAIVRHLVELHGGTVSVDSQGEQQGSTFTVSLPLSHCPPIPLSSHPPMFSTPIPLGPSLLNVRVLIVDDEADSRDFISTVLQQCQAEVLAVGSVQEALQAISQWKPDVLVSDIGMPEEDGYSFIRKLRSQPPEQGGTIPAAALTAYARAEDRMRAIKEGYQLHLPKPIEPAELATVVASLVGRS